MTTNKPEIVGHANSEQLRHFREWGGHLPRLLEEATPTTVPLIRLTDYENLQAECDKLRKDAARLDWLADMSNPHGHVMLPTECVEMNMDDMRKAIDAAMELEK